jgi:uncharacterized protein (DUF433 family)
MKLPDYLSEDRQGSIRIAGHRIGLIHLLHCYNEGYSAEELLCEYPTLSLSLIHRVIAFYLDNKTEVDGYLARCNEEIEKQRRAAGGGPEIAELRKRLQARQVAKGA